MNSEIKRRLTILDVVAKHCLFTGAEMAAMELHSMDISQGDFVETMCRCPTIPDDIKINIQNRLSNLEKGLNTYRPSFNHTQARRRLRESLAPMDAEQLIQRNSSNISGQPRLARKETMP